MVGKDYFIFNEVKSADKNLLLRDYSRTLVVPPETTMRRSHGSLGSTVRSTGGKGDLLIVCQVASIKANENSTLDTMHGYWLDGSEKKLKFWDMPNRHYIATVHESSETLDQDLWLEGEITFVAKPYIVSDIQKVQNGESVVNEGTEAATGTIELTTTKATNELSVQNDSKKITIKRESGSFAEGTKFAIDLEDEYITIGIQSAMEYVTYASTFFDIEPGLNELVCKDCTSLVSFTERWKI